eukprot:6202418-Pleurochrysis_carterae.AAC.1
MAVARLPGPWRNHLHAIQHKHDSEREVVVKKCCNEVMRQGRVTPLAGFGACTCLFVSVQRSMQQQYVGSGSEVSSVDVPAIARARVKIDGLPAAHSSLLCALDRGSQDAQWHV